MFGGVQPPRLVEPPSQSAVPANEARQRLCESIRCEHGAECELGPDGFPLCSCQLNCSSRDAPPLQRICASDLKIYTSECEMRKEACHRQTELRPRPMELCEGSNTRTKTQSCGRFSLNPSMRFLRSGGETVSWGRPTTECGDG